MRLLILSFYYSPDLCAGSFRMVALIEAFKKLDIPNLEVDVITTQPNRYAYTSQMAEHFEDHGWLRIRRISLPAHNSDMRNQAWAFASFARQVLAQTRRTKWDCVFATSSRLMTAALGAAVARRQKAPLYLDIRDLFLDTMADVLHKSAARHLLPALRYLEKWTFRSATRINLVSEGFLPYLAHIAPKQTYRTFTNGIDPVFLETYFEKSSTSSARRPRVLYAGNIGEGQGLHSIIPKAATQLHKHVEMLIIGAGGRTEALKTALNDQIDLSPDAVKLLHPMPRQDLLQHYGDADILFLHLNDYNAFLKVLPSKIFEYAATGKPIVAGVAGYAGAFIDTHVPGAVVFDPCDAVGMVAAVEQALQMKSPVDRSVFCATYARSKIMRDMAQDILSIL